MATLNRGVRSEHEIDVNDSPHARTDKNRKTPTIIPSCLSGSGLDDETCEPPGNDERTEVITEKDIIKNIEEVSSEAHKKSCLGELFISEMV